MSQKNDEINTLSNAYFHDNYFKKPDMFHTIGRQIFWTGHWIRDQYQ